MSIAEFIRIVKSFINVFDAEQSDLLGTLVWFLAVLVFLKLFCHKVNICNNQKNLLVIAFGNSNFYFCICSFGNNF